MSALSKRDKEIVDRIRDRKNTAVIADELGVSYWNIRGRIRKLCREYDCAMDDLPATVARAR